MNSWKNFLDSLGTRGGAILLLLLCSILLGSGVMHVLHHGDLGDAASLIRSTFAGFVGALLLALKTSSDTPRNPDPNVPTPPDAAKK
jgi:hypothetical protein